MKVAKTLGLAVFMALAATAFIGAGSASATVFCKVSPETVGGDLVCPAGQEKAKNWDFQGVAKNPNFTLPNGTIIFDCAGSYTFGDSYYNTKLGPDPRMTVSLVELEGCNSQLFLCKGTINNFGYGGIAGPFEYVGPGSENGRLNIAAGLELIMQLPCGVKCKYTSPTFKGGFSNASGELTIHHELTTKSGGFCYQTLYLDAKYKFTEPYTGNPVYVAKK